MTPAQLEASRWRAVKFWDGTQWWLVGFWRKGHRFVKRGRT